MFVISSCLDLLPSVPFLEVLLLQPVQYKYDYATMS